MSEKTSVIRRENNVITRKGENSHNNKVDSEFNKVSISGRFETELEYSHKVNRIKFYSTRVRVARVNGVEDFVPIIVAGSLIARKFKKKSLKGKRVEISGQFRSYNEMGEDGCKHLKLFLFVTVIKIYEDEDGQNETINSNFIYLDGYICKTPFFRRTPLGKRITELLIAVNRPGGKSDYIPCIVWGNLARQVSEFEVGNRVELYGRVQSRRYFKKFSPDSEEGEERVAYEISASEIHKVQDLRGII